MRNKSGSLEFAAILPLILLALLLMPAVAARAAGPVRADFSGDYADVTPAMKLVRSKAASVAIQAPSGKPGESLRVELSATGKTAPHYWVFFPLSNPAAAPRRFILQISPPSFAGSGLRPLTAGMRVFAYSATPPARIAAAGPDAASLVLPASATASVFAETQGPSISSAWLWKAESFAARRSRDLFLAGALTGIALLAAIALFMLYALRQMPTLPAAALFTLGAAGFIAIHTGALAPALAWIGAPDALMRLAAFFEGLMLTGLTAWIFFWLELPRRSRLLLGLAIALTAATALLAVWALFDPPLADAMIRPAFLLAVVAGSGLTVILWKNRRTGASNSLVTIAVLFVWTVFAALAAAGLLNWPNAGMAVSMGLVIVLLSLAVTMARAAFAPAAGLRRFFSDATRRALALAGAHQAVWDYDAISGALHTGPELESELGLPPATISHGGAKGFAARMHPSDLPAYEAAVEAALHGGRGRFSVQFRLRRADGGYRWYLLRAHPMRDSASQTAPTRLIGALSDVTSIRRTEERILSDAVRDRVTGLPNRPLLLDRLGRAITRAATSTGAIYLLVLDIDRFRSINDAWGFETGDALLKRAASRIARVLEPEDTLARLPGDQFAIIMDATTGKPRDVTAFATRLRKLLARPFDLGVREVSITVCLGITALRGAGGMKAEDALRQAEMALFEARKRGNDAMAFFEESMLTGRSRMISLEQDLRRAVERNEIEVVYQPIMNLAAGHLAGFEALARWRHPLHGLLGPDSFVSLAEEIGLIGDISRVVMSEAVRNLGVWQRAFRPDAPLFMAVNISSVQLLNATLPEEVAALIEREGIAPETLKIELTESLIMENPGLGRKILERLAGQGVKIACDDFGTGYSSLSNLRELPFSTLKIDRAFVDTDADDPRAGVILRSIIEMAHGLGMDVVAEGVETEEQMARLAAMHCDMVQGWHIGQPISARRVIEALTGVSLDVSARSRFAAFRDRLRGKGEDGEEDASRPLVMPAPPIPHAPAPPAPQTDADEEGETDALPDEDGARPDTVNGDEPAREPDDAQEAQQSGKDKKPD